MCRYGALFSHSFANFATFKLSIVEWRWIIANGPIDLANNANDIHFLDSFVFMNLEVRQGYNLVCNVQLDPRVL